GRVHRGRADFGKGSPANPMTDAELTEKFRQCAAWGGFDRDRTQRILDTLWNIESLQDINTFTQLLR
ncbi:MAG TPA: hypothetical protein VM073_02115, partial [Usitatibacter sp.]|nr:hypothetical protein [Usitatibacter sp.]